MRLRLGQCSRRGTITTKIELRMLSRSVSWCCFRLQLSAKQELVGLVNAYACRVYDEELKIVDEHGGEFVFLDILQVLRASATS